MPRLKQLEFHFWNHGEDAYNHVQDTYKRNLRRRPKCKDHSADTASTKDAPRPNSGDKPGEQNPQT